MNQLNVNHVLDHSKTIRTFSLKPLNSSSKSSLSIEIQFSPIINKDNFSTSTIPNFNSDRKYYTPAFCVQHDASTQQFTEQNFCMNFKNQKKQHVSLNNTILQTKPNSKYCQICREDFGDYLKHIEHPIHNKKLKEGDMQPSIKSLIQYFKKIELKTNKRSSSTVSPPSLVTSHSEKISFSQIEVNNQKLIGTPQKKIKKDEDICLSTSSASLSELNKKLNDIQDSFKL